MEQTDGHTDRSLHCFMPPLEGRDIINMHASAGSKHYIVVTTWLRQWCYVTEARDSEWQWHKLGYMQICTSPQTDNDASIPPTNWRRSCM